MGRNRGLKRQIRASGIPIVVLTNSLGISPGKLADWLGGVMPDYKRKMVMDALNNLKKTSEVEVKNG